jgi:hypothetical protein
MKHRAEWAAVALLRCLFTGPSVTFGAETDDGSSKPVGDGPLVQHPALSPE